MTTKHTTKEPRFVATKHCKTPNLISALAVSEQQGVTLRRIQKLCADGRVHGAHKVCGVWMMPVDYWIKPAPHRVREPLKIHIRARKR